MATAFLGQGLLYTPCNILNVTVYGDHDSEVRKYSFNRAGAISNEFGDRPLQWFREATAKVRDYLDAEAGGNGAGPRSRRLYQPRIREIHIHKRLTYRFRRLSVLSRVYETDYWLTPDSCPILHVVERATGRLDCLFFAVSLSLERAGSYEAFRHHYPGFNCTIDQFEDTIRHGVVKKPSSYRASIQCHRAIRAAYDRFLADANLEASVDRSSILTCRLDGERNNCTCLPVLFRAG